MNVSDNKSNIEFVPSKSWLQYISDCTLVHQLILTSRFNIKFNSIYLFLSELSSMENWDYSPYHISYL